MTPTRFLRHFHINPRPHSNDPCYVQFRQIANEHSDHLLIPLIAGLVALSGAVPQRFRQRASPRLRQRQGRQETGYLAPALDSYAIPAAADAPEELYAVPEEPVADATDLDNSYLAPAATDVEDAYAAPAEASDDGYLAPAEYADESYSEYEEYEEEAAADTGYLAPAPADEVPVYAETEEELGGYENDLDSAASDAEGSDPLKMLMNAVPGVPGEDYPIYAETPETAFSCEGQVDGGEQRHLSYFFKFKLMNSI